MDLIVETDIGHDPDDFFALCYLASEGVNIRAILISPGDPDQIAIAKLFTTELGLDIPIGVSHKDRNKNSSGSIHHDLLNKYGRSLSAKADGAGENIMEDVLKKYPDCELFVIGPVTSIGRFMKKHPEVSFKRATMQGGFLPYSLHWPAVHHPDFSGKESMPTFNLNGDREGGAAFLNGNIQERRMVGKNVCHTVLFEKDVFELRTRKQGRAWELFEEAGELYFRRHEFKKFHDPTAAACHLYPEIGTWVRGKTIKAGSGWTTEVNPEGDYVLAEVDYDLLWERILGIE